MGIVVRVVKSASFHKMTWIRNDSKLVYTISKDADGISVLVKQIPIEWEIENDRRASQLVLTLQTVTGLHSFDITDDIKKRKGWTNLTGGRIFDIVLQMAEAEFRTDIHGNLMEEDIA